MALDGAVGQRGIVNAVATGLDIGDKFLVEEAVKQGAEPMSLDVRAVC